MSGEQMISSGKRADNKEFISNSAPEQISYVTHRLFGMSAIVVRCASAIRCPYKVEMGLQGARLAAGIRDFEIRVPRGRVGR